MTMNSILVNIAENTDQGSRSGKASVFHFGNVCSMWANNFDGYILTHSKNHKDHKRFRIHRKIYPYADMIPWHGNMIYNGYRMKILAATELLNDLWASKKWNAETIDCKLEEFLTRDGYIFPADFQRILKSYYK